MHLALYLSKLYLERINNISNIRFLNKSKNQNNFNKLKKIPEKLIYTMHFQLSMYLKFF